MQPREFRFHLYFEVTAIALQSEARIKRRLIHTEKYYYSINLLTGIEAVAQGHCMSSRLLEIWLAGTENMTKATITLCDLSTVILFKLAHSFLNTFDLIQ